MPTYTSAGADAAGDYDELFRQLIANDPEIQAVIRRVWGDTPVGSRPSDTPKDLESANHQASQEIAQILQRKGVTLPDRTFVNPRSASLEGHRGWAGLSGIQKAAIIAAVGATGVGAAGALGAFGGGTAAAGGAGASAAAPAAGLGVTAGVPAGLAGVGATGVLPTALGAGGAAAGAGGGGLLSGLTAAGKIGGLLSGAASNLQADRYGTQLQNLSRDRLTGDLYNTQQDAIFRRAQQELEQKKFGQAAPVVRARQASLGDILANIQDVNISPPAGITVPTITGGLRPSALGPNARQAGGELSRQALLKLMSGDDEKFSPMPLLTPPKVSQMSPAGTGENLLGILGTIGGLAGGLGEVFGKRTPATR